MGTVFTIATFANEMGVNTPRRAEAGKGAKADKGAKASKDSKTPKGRDTECDFMPMIVSEPSLTDKYITPKGNEEDDDSDVETGGMWMWRDNPICLGDKADCNDSTKIGMASGTCLTFFDPEICDSVDYLNFSDGSSLYFRGMDDATGTPAVVIGGTKCFYGARGTVKSNLGYFANDDEYWTYDLNKVTMD